MIHTMVRKELHCKEMFPTPYGCYCGTNIQGLDYGPPLDEFDAACLKHDNCYEDILAIGCSTDYYYIEGYNWIRSMDQDLVCAFTKTDPLGRPTVTAG